MSTVRGHFPGLLALLLSGLALSARAQSTTPLASDDQARCKTGDLGSCVRSEAARCDAGEAKSCVDLSDRYFGGVAVSRGQRRDNRWPHRRATPCQKPSHRASCRMPLPTARIRSHTGDPSENTPAIARSARGGNDRWFASATISSHSCGSNLALNRSSPSKL